MDILLSGGPVLLAIVLLSLYAVYVFFYRFLRIRNERTDTAELMVKVNAAVRVLLVRYSQIPPQYEAVQSSDRNLRALQARTPTIDPNFLETELSAVEQLANNRARLLGVTGCGSGCGRGPSPGRRGRRPSAGRRGRAGPCRGRAGTGGLGPRSARPGIAHVASQ